MGEVGFQHMSWTLPGMLRHVAADGLYIDEGMISALLSAVTATGGAALSEKA